MKHRNPILSAFLAMVLAGCVVIQATGNASKTPVKRPAFVGIAHIALKVSDLSAARDFYTRVLGFQEAFTIGSGELTAVCFKVNDHQYIEVSPTLKDKTGDRLSHIAYETTDAQRLRDYLASRGIAVVDKLRRGSDRNLSFMVQDPDGHNVEFVQYLPGSLHSRNFGKFLADTRISDHIVHVGVTVKDHDLAEHFYKDILDFGSIGSRGAGGDHVAVPMPEGSGRLEYMFNLRKDLIAIMNHVALSVPNMEEATRVLLERGMKYNEEFNDRRQASRFLNLLDPDGTRIELDAVPRPSSPALPR
jgi:catechol 2,3-dioxygenase-like lactoylglutathione lyase family enzyme